MRKYGARASCSNAVLWRLFKRSDIILSFPQNLRIWNSHSRHDISNRNFLSSDIDDHDFDGGRNTSLGDFSSRERNFYDRRGNYFPPSYISRFGGLWNSERHSRRKTKEDAFDDSAHFRFFRCFIEMRVSSPSSHHVNVRGALILLTQISIKLLILIFSKPLWLHIISDVNFNVMISKIIFL